MKIAIMTDSHDHWERLEKAIELAHEKGCELLLFAGDFISPPGLEVLAKFKGKVKFVWGNNEAERTAIVRAMDASENMEMCGDVYEDEVDGVKIFMNHYPKIAELAAKSCDYDLSICGHSHKWEEKRFGDCIYLNAGEIQGWRTGTSSFGVFDTEDSSIERVIVYQKK